MQPACNSTKSGLFELSEVKLRRIQRKNSQAFRMKFSDFETNTIQEYATYKNCWLRSPILKF